MSEPEGDGPSGILVDVVRAVTQAPRWILRRLRRAPADVNGTAKDATGGAASETSNDPAHGAGPAQLSSPFGDTPVTIAICAAGILLSIAAWTRPGLDAFVLDRRGFSSEPWRLLSTHFVHVNLIHLYFNVTWIWFLGREIERRLGSVFLVEASLFLLLGTSAVVEAFDRGGIGLSGLVYGLWALVFVGGRRCERLHGILTTRTNMLMVVWFFACIVMTITGTLPVSNWGHGGGAVFGALTGAALRADGGWRWTSRLIGAAVLAVLACGATLWWPSWNFGGAAHELWVGADQAYGRSDWTSAEASYRRVVKLTPRDASAWWNLGCALTKLGRDAEALDAFWSAHERGPLASDQQRALSAELLLRMNLKIAHGDERAALEFARRAVAVLPDDRETWEEIERMAGDVGDTTWSERASSELARLRRRP